MFTIYTIPYCNYCYNTINLLENFDKKIIEVEEKDKYNVKIKNGMSTFPQIFFQYYQNDELINERIGGYDDLLLLIRIISSIDDKKFSIDLIRTLLNIKSNNLIIKDDDNDNDNDDKNFKN